MLVGFDRSTEIGLRDYAIVNLMVRTGLREIEVARLNTGDPEKSPVALQGLF
jgi:integrase/recombinase XerC/integrase/recombinase XerD